MIPHQINTTRHAGAIMPTVDLSPHAQQETYAIARFIMDIDDFLIGLIGQSDNEVLFNWVYAILVFLLSWGVGFIAQWMLVKLLRGLGKHLHNDYYTRLTDANFFTKTCRIVPAVVFLILIQFTLTGKATLASWLSRLTWVYILYMVAVSLCIIADVMWQHIDTRANKRKLPLNGLVQLVKGIIWIVTVIVIIGILVNKSPGALLTGLGAFAAVLMLIFKDSILGVVAGVQLSENDSLHVGDWIKVDGTNANGNVISVSLTQVKVLNWDKTITTIPPYNLVSGSFTNYRSMQRSNTRRICRSYNIDADSVVPADDALLAEFAKIPLMKDWIEKKIEQKKAGRECNAANPDGLVDGTIDTNLGVFRAYLQLYLNSNPHIDKESDCFISTLPQTSSGIPLQVYCFTNTSKWIPYEAIMSALFEHVAVMLYRFHLYTYENPSGRDTIIDGYICPGKNPDVVFGMPYPFFNNGGTPENPAYPLPKSAYPQPAAMTPPATQNPEPGSPAGSSSDHPEPAHPDPVIS